MRLFLIRNSKFAMKLRVCSSISSNSSSKMATSFYLNSLTRLMNHEYFFFGYCVKLITLFGHAELCYNPGGRGFDSRRGH
jgi:hypothetical protein